MRRSLSITTPVLKLSDLCNYLKVSPTTIYRLLKTGELPAFKIGGSWRFNIEEIERWQVENELRPNS